jgi:hypothetical protein
VTRSEVDFILKLYNQIMNAEEEGNTDAEKDAWWVELGSKVELLSTVLKKDINKQRLAQWAQKCKRVMKDTANWLNQLDGALSRRPDRSSLLGQARAALTQGRRGDLNALKADIHNAVVDELSAGGGA